jgi:hypothetical protein
VVPVKDAGAPAEAMLRLGRDPELRERMGKAGSGREDEVRSPRSACAVAHILTTHYSILNSSPSSEDRSPTSAGGIVGGTGRRIGH